LSQLLSKITVTSCSFYITMFNVSSLLLDNGLLECVVTDVVLFQLLLLRHWHFTR